MELLFHQIFPLSLEWRTWHIVIITLSTVILQELVSVEEAMTHQIKFVWCELLHLSQDNISPRPIKKFSTKAAWIEPPDAQSDVHAVGVIHYNNILPCRGNFWSDGIPLLQISTECNTGLWVSGSNTAVTGLMDNGSGIGSCVPPALVGWRGTNSSASIDKSGSIQQLGRVPPYPQQDVQPVICEKAIRRRRPRRPITRYADLLADRYVTNSLDNVLHLESYELIVANLYIVMFLEPCV